MVFSISVKQSFWFTRNILCNRNGLIVYRMNKRVCQYQINQSVNIHGLIEIFVVVASESDTNSFVIRYYILSIFISGNKKSQLFFSASPKRVEILFPTNFIHHEIRASEVFSSFLKFIEIVPRTVGAPLDRATTVVATRENQGGASTCITPFHQIAVESHRGVFCGCPCL